MVLLRKPYLVPVLAILLSLGLPGLAAPVSAQTAAGEYDIKAAFLYNFAKFVEWPPDAFDAPGSPMTLCIVGKDPFGDTLDTLVRGETLQGRRMTVHRTRDLLEIRDCHIVFLSQGERSRQSEVLATVRGARILTVGESDGFLADGGIIRFVLHANRVRFEVNLASAERNGLKISSQLLRLARSVQPAGRGE
jgi:hypothetical protein